MNAGSTSKIDEIDRIVAAKLRFRRKELGLSQNNLARVLNVSVQQIQKYEKATNRVSAGNLYKLSHKLGVSLSYFFDGIEDLILPEDKEVQIESERNQEVQTLIKYYNQIEDKGARKQLLTLIKSFTPIN